MGNTKAQEDLIGKIAAIKWNGGYDRNGSHDAGEYVDYEGAIGEVLNHDQMHAIAEWVDAQLAERDAQLAAAYEAGQRDMRDAAAIEAYSECWRDMKDDAHDVSKAIRALPIQTLPATRQPTQDKGGE